MGRRYALAVLLLVVGGVLLYMALTPKGRDAWKLLVEGVGGYTPSSSASGASASPTASKTSNTVAVPAAGSQVA